MSTVKISQLPEIAVLNANTAQTIFMAVDTVTGITGRFSGQTLAEGLYSHNKLNVGNNHVILANVLGQFAGSSESFVQLNVQNFDGRGSGDIVVTANNGTDSTYFIDMGMNGDQFSTAEYDSMKALDGYLVVQGDTDLPGGNLVIGTATPNKNVNVILGGTTKGDIFAQFIDETGFKMVNRPVIFQDNTTQNTAAASFAHSNAIFLKANSAYGSQNTTGTYANSAFNKTNSAYTQANTATTNAGLASDAAATAITNASVADGKAVTAGAYANSAFLKANTPPAIANSAALYANGAFAKANSALANATGTFAGDLTLTGNLTAVGIYSTTGPISTGNLSVNGTANVTGRLNVVGAVSMNATLVLANSNFTATESAVTITASPSVALPVNDGYMIHISGKNGIPTRIVSDAYGTGAYSVYASRSARGTVTSPTAVQSGDIMGRFSANGYGTTKWQQFGTGRIDFVAAENYTDAATGSQIQFWNCPVGSNTLTNILSLNGDSASFTGVVSPQKGFLLTPNVLSGITTTLNIDIANNSLYYFKTNATTTINLSNYRAGKIVEVWLTNTDTGAGSNHTITHGCLANNSTIGATSFTLTSLHSAYIKYFSIDGDQANTFCQVTYS